MVTTNSINKTSDSIAKLETVTGSNENTMVTLTDDASAVNYLNIQNAATSDNPTITATGSDTDVGLTITTKGDADIALSSNTVSVVNTGDTSVGGTLQLLEASDNGTNAVAFRAPASLSASATYILPDTDTDGVLTNTSGTLSWGAGGSDTAAGTTIVKSTNQSRSSTTTYATDSELFFTANANSTYLVRFIFKISSAATPDWKYRVVMPTGSLAMGFVAWADDLTTSGVLSDKWFVTESGTVWGATIGNVASTTAFFQYMDATIRVGGTGGTIGLQWAQDTSNATPAVVYAGGLLYYVEGAQ